VLSDLYLFSRNRGIKESACSYYRSEVPISQIVRQYRLKCYVEDVTSDSREALQALLSCDIAHFYAGAGEEFLHLVKTLKNLKSKKDPSGRLKIAPIVIYDIDDNNEFTHPLNPAFAYLGVREYPNLNHLEPGDTLEITGPDGSILQVWEDGVTTSREGIPFNISRNLHETKIRHEIMRTVHAITTPSPVLASYLKNVVGQPNVYVFPNTILPEHYESFPLVRTDPFIRVLWQGGHSHWIDWYPLRDAVREVTARNKNLKWVIYGSEFKWITDVVPESQLELVSWTPYEAYKLRRSLLQIDINFCPLVDNLFNRCKSGIKFYEASIWDKPETTLAQKVGPYQEEIKDGETGLLFTTPAEMVEKLEILVKEADLRNKLAQNAKAWVLENRTPDRTIPPLVEFYTEIRKERIREAFQGTSEEIKKLAQEHLVGS